MAAPQIESSNQLVWFITGCSTGFGNQFVTSALARGDKVIATARPGSIAKLNPLTESLDIHVSERCKVMELDVTSSEEVIENVARDAVGIWGRVDVVVNNAATAVAAMLEEGGMHCIKMQYETNVYGPMKVTNAFLPYMRGRRSGAIVFMGSRSGWQTNVTMRGLYASSKAALHALAETYAAELKGFGIKTLCFMPGAFRTPAIRVQEVIDAEGKTQRSLSSEMLLSQRNFEDYDVPREAATTRWASLARREPGDPVAGVETMIDFVRGEGRVAEYLKSGKELPVGVFLGSDCIENVEQKLEEVLGNIREWRAVSIGADFREDHR